MKAIILLIFYSSFTSFYLFGQNWDARYYIVGNDVVAMCSIGDTIFAGTRGGLYVINSETLETTLINELNSDFKGYQVNSIASTMDNKLYVAVEFEGLNYFNGKDWINYNTENSNITSNYLDNLTIDHQNRLWYIGNSGLCMFDGDNFVKFEDIGIHDINIDSSNNVWGIAGDKVGMVSNNSFIPLEHIMINAGVGDIAFDKTNTLFMTVSKGIVTFDGSNWNYYDGISGTLQVDQNGDVYVYSSVIFKFNNNEWTEYIVYTPPSYDLSSNFSYWARTPNKFIFNSKNQIIINGWVSYFYSSYTNPVNPLIGNNIGISIQKDNNWIGVKLSNTEILPSTQLSSTENIAFEGNKHVWFGTYNSGLIKYDYKYWYRYGTNNNSAGALQESMAYLPQFDSKGILWFLGDDGLCKMVADSFYYYNFSTGDIPTNLVSYFLIDKDDNKWLATKNHGIIKFDDSSYVQYDINPNDYNLNGADMIWIDIENNIWGSSFDEPYVPMIFKFDGEKFTKYTYQNSALSEYYYAISMMQDFNGSIYFGTRPTGISFTGELIRLNNDGTWDALNDYNTPPKSFVTSMAIDSLSNKWLCSPWDLTKYNGSDWITYKPENSILPRELSSISVDELNNIWVSTFNGIFVFNENKFIDITGVKRNHNHEYNQFILEQNYPNPFNPRTVINYSLNKSSKVKLMIFDCLGREIKTLVDEYQLKGDYKVEFNAFGLSSGIYFYLLQTDQLTISKKMLYLK